MEGNMKIREIMQLLHPLSADGKLEIIYRLTKELKADIHSVKERKKKLLNELFGAWKDVDEGLIDEILNSRTISDKNISLD